MLPNTKEHVTAKQADQKLQHDQHTRPCFLFPGSLVLVRVYVGPSKWNPGVVVRKLGPLTYDVETRDGRTIKRHADQLRLRKDNSRPDTSEVIVTQEDVNVRDNHKYEDNATQEIEGAQTQTDPLNHAILRGYAILLTAMSLTVTDYSTPDRGGDVVT